MAAALVPATIVTQPEDQTAVELLPVGFSVEATGNPVPRLQWFRNDVSIAKATNSTYTFTTTLADEGAVFRVEARNTVSGVPQAAISSNAVLHVTADLQGPLLLRGTTLSMNVVQLEFSEGIWPGSASNLASYSLTSPSGDLSVTNVIVDGRKVLLGTTTATLGALYTATVSGLQDLAQAHNTIVPDTQITFAAVAFNAGDVGEPALPGSTTKVANGFDLAATGGDVGGKSDQFQYNYQLRTGDFDVQVRVESLTFSDAWAKAGLMARETLATNSRFAGAFATPTISGSFFAHRFVTGGLTTNVGSFPATYPNTWLRLKRAGTVLTGYASFDGALWTPLGSIAWPVATAPATVYLGMALSGANPAALATSGFRDFAEVTDGKVGSPTFTREPLGPSTRRTALVISEIMYHPRKILGVSNSLEFIEIFNSQPFFENVSGFQLVGDIHYLFPPNTVIPAGGFLVVARDPQFVQKYYGISGVLGPGDGAKTNGLSGNGGTVRLLSHAGAILLEVNYQGQNPWPIAADGAGHSLVLARASYGEGSPLAWAASDRVDGSPGRPDPFGSDPLGTVVINEFLANTTSPADEFIELYNHSTASVDLSGAYLSDDPATNKFRIPNGTTLAARGFVSFPGSALGFSLSSAGERIYFVNPSQTRVIDSVEFEAQSAGVSSGRVPDGAPVFYPLAELSPGAANGLARIEDIVITEIMYNPISGNSADEYVELYNRGGKSIDISQWTFTAGISFTFPAGTTIPPDGYLVVAKNAANLRGHYPNLSSANTVGDYNGTLSNGGERIALARPEIKVTTDANHVSVTNTLSIVVNEVTYRDGGRWGHWSDGGGSSLELVDPRSNNRLASNWAESDETAKSEWATVEYTGPVGTVEGVDVNTGQQGNDHLQVFLLGVGECLVDNIEVLNSTNKNLIANSGFETGLTGWTLQGSHDQSTLESVGFESSRSLHLRASSRGDNGANKVRSAAFAGGLNTKSGIFTLRAKARWLSGFPELLLRVHGGGLEAPGRLPVPVNLGTPGARNSRALPNNGPAIYSVTHTPPMPAANEPVVVTAKANDPDGLSSLTLRYRIDPSGAYVSVAMTDNGSAGDAIAGDGVYSATIPGQTDGKLVAFYLQAVDGAAAQATNLFPQDVFPQAPLKRTFPNDGATRECVVRFGDRQMMGSYATYRFWLTATNVARWTTRDNLNNAPMDCTFVYNNYRVIYNAMPQYGGSSWHRGQMTDGPASANLRVDYVLNFPGDDRLLGVTDFVFNTVGNPGGNTSSDPSAQAEQTSYLIFREMDIHYNYRRYIHLFVNGSQRSITGDRPGNFIMEDSQQPNGDGVVEWYGVDDGELYKIEDWFEFNNEATSHANIDAKLTRVTTTVVGITRFNLAPYRFMWRKRSVGAAESASNYQSIFDVVDAVSPSSSPTSPTILNVPLFESLVNYEQWMRIFAVQHTVGNWDSYGYSRGKNCFTYKPRDGQFELMTWDIDFTMGVGGDGADTALFGSVDPRVGAMYNTPVIQRAYWRAYQDIINGPLNRSFMDPILDAKAAAHGANAVNYDPNVVTTIKNYVTARRNYIAGQIPKAVFVVSGTNFVTTETNLVRLSGIAPITIKDLTVNGILYPVTWSAATAWSLRLVVNPGTNQLVIEAYDRFGKLLSEYSRTNTVVYTGVAPQPEGQVVISEIMYNPLVLDASFVEIRNTSPTASFDLSGWRLSGVSFAFPPGTVLTNGQFLVVCKDALAFARAYNPSVYIAGEFSGQLNPAGETLTLLRPGSQPGEELIVNRVRYEAQPPWSQAPNGHGASLQLIDASQDNSRVSNWHGSEQKIWQFYSYTNILGSTNLSLQIEGAPGDVYLDDLFLVQGSVAPGTGENVIVNGDFESGSLAPWISNTLATNSEISTTYAHTGNNSLHLIFNGGTLTLTNFYQALPSVISSTNYTFSFWYLAGAGGSNFTARIGSAFKPSVSIRRILSTPGGPNTYTATLPPYPPVWLNELQARNTGSLADNHGDLDPWIELYNAGANTLSLDGFYLAGSYSNLTEWAFPASSSLAPGQFKVLFADGQPGQSTALEWHTSFRLSGSTGSVALVRLVNGAPQILDYLNYSDLAAGESYGSYPDGQPFDRKALSYPTPGGPNNGAAPPLRVFINEWMASNTKTISDPAGPAPKFDDWFELYNAGTSAVDLAGYFLTDNFNNKEQFTIPSGYPIAPKGHLLVWADNETNQNISAHADLHVNFQLTKRGEEIGLYAPDGTAVDTVSFGAQTDDISQGRWPDGAAALHFMPEPTPRTANVIPGQANTRPILLPIGNRVLPEMNLLSFTAVAMDADQPPQKLSFSLGAGAPQGASITPEGKFSWRPLESQGPASHSIIVRVTDDGTPPLSAEQTIQVAVEEVNSGPYFVDTRPKYVNAGSLLTFPTAADPDLPPQTLAFILAADAPVGSSLHPVTGVFRWTPAENLVPGLYHATVQATDNGHPPISASYTYTIEVKAKADTLIVVEAARSGAAVQLSWPATPGKTYQLLYKDNLNQTTWQIRADNLQTQSSTITFTDTPPGQRIYQVRQLD